MKILKKLFKKKKDAVELPVFFKKKKVNGVRAYVVNPGKKNAKVFFSHELKFNDSRTRNVYVDLKMGVFIDCVGSASITKKEE